MAIGPNPPPSPSRIGRYELLRLLGRGGQGQVWEVVLHGPGGMRKHVALKLLADGVGLAREARLGGLLRHRNLVDVYEVGESDGTWFCAMELCRGGSLAERMPLTPRAVVEVGLQVCDALQYAHEELGLVHRDLKPSNLLLDDGTVKVADLGIARADGFVAPRVAGTRGYMAPELALGRADARSDVYALGVVLHELATGTLPNVSETFTLDEAVDPAGYEAWDPPMALGSDVPWLVPVLERCLASDPSDRFGSMAELAVALRSLVVEGPGLREALGVEPARDERSGAVLEHDLFVGRGAELAELMAVLERPAARVLLKGPAGIGKTALATRAVRLAQARGAWVRTLDLVEARSVGALLRAVALALEAPLREGDEGQHAEQLAHALAARTDVILVLDGADGLLDQLGLLERWRVLAPALRMVFTSRAAVQLPELCTIEVPPLDEVAAVELLAARARQRGVEVDDDPVLTQLARRLDGLPLALELAAGRLGVLTPADVLERLDLSLLRSADDPTGRHASLRGALRESWDALTEPEQQAVAQLSVFRGGFTAEAAEAVVQLGPGAPWILDVLVSLVDRSLLVARGERLGMLEPVRAFAREQLADDHSAAERHGAWFARLGAWEHLATLDFGGGAQRRLLACDLDNLLAACRRAIQRGDHAVALGCCMAAWEIVRLSGPLALGLELVGAVEGFEGLTREDRAQLAWARGIAEQSAGSSAAALAHFTTGAGLAGSALPVLAMCELGIGQVCVDLGRSAEAERALESAATRFRALGRPGWEAVAIGSQSGVHFAAGRLDLARACSEHAVARHRATGNRRQEGAALANLGILYFRSDRLEQARACYERAIACYVEGADRGLQAIAWSNLGNLHQSAGRHVQALACYEEALECDRMLGAMRGEGRVRCNLASTLLALDEPQRALEHLERALPLNRRYAAPLQIALNLGMLGRAHAALGARDRARRCLEEAREHAAGAPKYLATLDERLAALDAAEPAEG